VETKLTSLFFISVAHVRGCVFQFQFIHVYFNMSFHLCLFHCADTKSYCIYTSYNFSVCRDQEYSPHPHFSSLHRGRVFVCMFSFPLACFREQRLYLIISVFLHSFPFEFEEGVFIHFCSHSLLYIFQYAESQSFFLFSARFQFCLFQSPEIVSNSFCSRSMTPDYFSLQRACISYVNCVFDVSMTFYKDRDVFVSREAKLRVETNTLWYL